MSKIFQKCIEYNDQRRNCVASENGKVFTLNNISGYKVRKVKIDKCLMQKVGEKRCDYLMNINDSDLKKVFFIELKGGKILDGVKQIHQTFEYLKNEFENYIVEARIVGSNSVPNIKADPSYLKLRRELVKTKGDIVIRTNNSLTERI